MCMRYAPVKSSLQKISDQFIFECLKILNLESRN